MDQVRPFQSIPTSGPHGYRSPRAGLIGQLYSSERGQVLAKLLLDVETDPDLTGFG